MSNRLQQQSYSTAIRSRPEESVAQGIARVARSIRASEIPISTLIGLIVLALAAITAVAVVIALRTRVSVAAVGWLYLLIVLPVTLRWGRMAGLATAGVAAFLLLTFLTEPRGLPYTKNGIDLISLLLSTGCIAIAVLLVHPAGRGQREHERELAEMVRSSVDAVIDASLDGTILGWSAGAERLFVYRPQQAVGRPISLLLPRSQAAGLCAGLEALGRGERVASYETAALCSDGKRLDVSVTVSPVRDADGSVRKASLLVYDMTACKRVEQAFRAGDGMLVTAIEKLTDGLLVLDQSGNVLLANGPARLLLRSPSEPVPGGSFDDLFTHRYSLHPTVRWQDVSRVANLRFVALDVEGLSSGLYVEVSRLVAQAPLHTIRYVMTLRDAAPELQAAYEHMRRQDLRRSESEDPGTAMEPVASGAANDNGLTREAEQAAGQLRAQHGLTNREVEVLLLLAKGCSNQEIADELCITLNTAERHIANLYRKLHVRSRTHAAAYALQHGLIPPFAP
jgi:PAS domain S-box-containing protein